MIRNAIGLPSLTRASRKSSIAGVCLLGLLCIPSAAHAQIQASGAATGRDADLVDAALTPLADLNLARDPIPMSLLEARAAPYRDSQLTTCADIRQQIGDLDAVLGEDFDSGGNNQQPSLTPGNVAKRLVENFIPFRGIIREISGANNHQALFREAIIAGLARRAFLKGIGQERGCAYPARPIPTRTLPRIRSRPVSLDIPLAERDGRLVWERS